MWRHSRLATGLVALALLLCVQAAPLCGQVSAPERAALLALYDGTNGPGWINSNGWAGAAGSECTWFGVTCNASNQVRNLVLSDNNLSGSLPDLSALTALRILYLQRNDLSGSIPSLSALTDLRELALSENDLSGPIPELSSLTQLRELILFGNQLTGTIPDLSALTQLEFVRLNSNQLEGGIPDLSSNTQLLWLFLGRNNLSGPIPDLSSLTALTRLSFDRNDLTGSIPDLSGLVSIQSLVLSANALTGSVPDLSGLSNLRALVLANNRLSGPIPDLSGLSQLEEVRLSGNLLVGALPAIPASVLQLEVAANALVQELPDLSGGSLVGLDLSYNGFVGRNAGAAAFASSLAPGWNQTQTVPPRDLQATPLSATTIELVWTPIAYVGGAGRYRVAYGTNAGGPYETSVSVEDKRSSTARIEGLQPDTTYYLVVSTESDANANNRSRITSLTSPEISVTTPPVAVGGGEELVASFEAQPSVAGVGETIRFVDRSTGEPDGWSWDFGDGGTSSVQNPTHSYTAPGTYQVGLRVSRGEESSSASSAIRVVDPPALEDEETLVAAESAPQDPVVVYDSSGRKAVVWEAPDGDGFGIFAQRFDTSGAPTTGVEAVNATTAGNQTQPAAALDADGGLTVVWVSADDTTVTDVEGRMVSFAGIGGSILGRRFEEAGLAGPEVEVTTDASGAPSNPQVSTDSGGDVTIVWEDDGQIRGRVQQRDGRFATPVLDLTTGDPSTAPDVARAATGEFVVAWRVRSASGAQARSGTAPTILGRRFDERGVPKGPRFTVTEAPGAENPVTAGDADGAFVVAWDERGEASQGRQISARLFDRSGEARGPAFRVSVAADGDQFRPRVDMNANGDFVVVWERELTAQPAAATAGAIGGSILGRFFDPEGDPVSGEVVVAEETVDTIPSAPDVSIDGRDETTAVFNRRGRDGGNRGIASRVIRPNVPSSSECTPSDEVLCLQGNRFRLRAKFQDKRGQVGFGRPVLLTEDTGYFWFFDDDNVEVVVKVLDACVLNDRFWVFVSGLTDVEVNLVVEDTAAGETTTYFNQQNQPFRPVLDTAALATCAFGPSSASSSMTESSWSEALVDDGLLASRSCMPSDTTLCLTQGRFAVDVLWSTAAGVSGQGRAVRLTADSGYFWFFDENNVELVVKTLDACSFSRSFWVFAAGLTDVEVELTVTDTAVGQSAVFESRLGHPFELIADTGTFMGCP